MSYTVFVRRLVGGESVSAPFAEVAAILQTYGDIFETSGGFEFVPRDDDICGQSFVEGDEDSGIVSISFDRPRFGRLMSLVFELLGIPGMCYFEQDVVNIYARTDITKDLPEGFLEGCQEDGGADHVTVVSSVADMEPWASGTPGQV